MANRGGGKGAGGHGRYITRTGPYAWKPAEPDEPANLVNGPMEDEEEWVREERVREEQVMEERAREEQMGVPSEFGI